MIGDESRHRALLSLRQLKSANESNEAHTRIAKLGKDMIDLTAFTVSSLEVLAGLWSFVVFFFSGSTRRITGDVCWIVGLQ